MKTSRFELGEKNFTPLNWPGLGQCEFVSTNWTNGCLCTTLKAEAERSAVCAIADFEDDKMLLLVTDPSVSVAPKIASFTASPTMLPAGGSVTLAYEFDADIAAIDQGIGTVTSGGTTNVVLTETTTFTLTAVRHPADAEQATVTVQVTPLQLSPVFPTNPTVTLGRKKQFTIKSIGGLTNEVTWSTQNGSITSDGLWTAPLVPGTWTITATSKDNNSVFQSTQVVVVPEPNILSFAANPPILTRGSTTILVPVFTDGIGSMDWGIGKVQSSVGISQIVTDTAIFTLTVTNSAGDTARSAVKVISVDVPQITRFEVIPAEITEGSQAVLYVSYQGGIADVQPSLGVQIVSGLSLGVSPSSTTVYRVTVQSEAGETAQQSALLTVYPAPWISSWKALKADALYGEPIPFRGVYSGGVAKLSEFPTTEIISEQVLNLTVTAPDVTLTVTNPLGVKVTNVAHVNLTPFTMVVTGPTSVSPDSTVLYSAAVTAKDTTVTWSATAGLMDPATGLWITPHDPGTYLLTVVPEAKVSEAQTLSVTVVGS